MTHLEWIIIVVGAVITIAIVVAASENEKRLDRIARLLQRANEERDQHRR